MAGLPVERSRQRAFLILMLLLLGAFLRHRNAGLYIFLGLAVATLAPAPLRRTSPMVRAPGHTWPDTSVQGIPAAGNSFGRSTPAGQP